MKWLSYCRSVVLGLITLTIGFAVINHFDAPFERVVVDLLVLIYVAVRGGTTFLMRATVEQAKLDRTRFRTLLFHMKATRDRQFESEDNQEALNEVTVNVIIRSVKLDSIFLSLVWLVAILNLLGALLK